MTNLYKNNKQNVSLFSDTSITTTDKYTSSILNSLLYNNSIQSGGLSFFKPKPQPQQVPQKTIYKNVTLQTDVSLSEQKQFQEFMLTHPENTIDKMTLMLNNYILQLNNIKQILNI
jgi:hypothetical protein